MSESTIAARMADWVAETNYDHLPRRVVEEAKNQILSVIASVHAGHFSEAGRIVSRTVKEWAGGKEATLIPSGERTSIHYAIFGNAALSMALDYDDYLFGGHTGHSAVLVPLALAEKLGIDGRDFLVAQVIANEIEGRIGIAASTGPAGGQRSAYLHQIGAAIITAKLSKLDRKQIENAIGIAMLQPCATLPAGFYGSDAKVLVAAATAPLGVQAAELAANGMRGAADAFECAGGFLERFAPTPVQGAFDAYGKVWLTETLAYKVYPGCASIGAAIDGALALVRQHHFDARKIRSVDVAVGPLALEAEATASPYLRATETVPTTLNFSLSYSVAAALIDRELSPRQFTRDRVKDAAVWELARRVRVGEDERLALLARERSPVRASAEGDRTRYTIDLDGADLSAVKRLLGARVRIELEDGRSFESEQESPLGSGARQLDDRRKAVEDKFRRETRYTLRKERMEKAIDLVHHAEDAGTSQLRELVRLCCSEKV
jgi:2-methylcitrate dehydratase PrpD